mmetsp:Transcript_8668/g.19464  ORF Transcript_8668/g.19464 Transcript_8668/m.19464 type:complete len:622 (+) Transcript_8668:280-2145(+)|eukprot:CAMPEP_0172314002 /NCGR_PEP_ID=MMETSP1058-20130122/21423_1 /TAXON_ID=83371 /ORGANISM="Detonula confervacea, Strain CCMP 353" /LENGTH=621 /DNA_ID=CAMNT_0013027749 /DNA_START=221 /DNA_END=2086 /DNA_ORIENTATION=+
MTSSQASDALLPAKEWSSLDPNSETSSYVENLIAQAEGGNDAAMKEVESLFNAPRIQFGTAGLRAHMEPGPCGMNDLVVIQTAQGLARYVLDTNNNKSSLKAVVGYDHRSHSKFNLSSKQFAMYTKLVFEHAGIKCTLLDGYVATPILAYAVTNIDAAVGIMVTASHNPKQDDGYKVYWKDGCQIIPPIDGCIANAIVEKENLVPWIDYGEQLRKLEAKSNVECYGLSDPIKTKSIEDAYFRSILSSGLVTGVDYAANATSSKPKFAYTAMHGVGSPYARRSFQTFNLPPFLAVPSQEKPDPNFSTVPFPNPEENGALDEAIEFSTENECDIVLANDPDADRLGVAECGRESGTWTVFNGNQIGTLLGHWLWETIGKNSDQPVAMCASTVSSKMLAAMGQTEGFRFDETLTGFKWIGSRALSLQKQGYRVLLGYEEAIGFSCGGIIPDKDGISALGVVATMASFLYSRGETLVSHLQKIHDKYGEFACNNGYYRCNDPAIVMRIMEQMRNGGKYFDRVGTYDVESIRDLGSPGYDSTTEDKKPTLPTSASSPMITFRFANGCVAQFRASGTEPKFKYYIELRGRPGEKKTDVERRLSVMSGVILEELLHPAKNGLILPSNL